jgi:hypothetical protein
VAKTVDFIKRKASEKKPFLVYVGYSELHPPVVGHPDFVGKSTQRGGLLADIIAEIDYRVGQILDAVKEAGVDAYRFGLNASGPGGVYPETV